MNLRYLKSCLQLLSPWLHLILELFHQFHPINFLYYLYCSCNLLKMTLFIVNRKLINLRCLELLFLSPLLWLRLFYLFFYQFYHLFISSIICKLLKMTQYIVDRKDNKFSTSDVVIDFAVARCCCLSLCF